MNDGERATHKHKRLGEVVLLSSTSELAQVLMLTTREKLWVKLVDLSGLVDTLKQDRRRKKL